MFFESALQAYAKERAIFSKGVTFTYRDIEKLLLKAVSRLDVYKVQPGTVVALEGDFTAATVAMLFSLFKRGCIVAPFSIGEDAQIEEKVNIAQIEAIIKISNGVIPCGSRLPRHPGPSPTN